MGYAFLWLEAMASALLLVAVVFSFSGRLKKWPTLWPFLTALLISALAVAATVFAGYLFFQNIHPQWLFPYSLSWTVLFVAGGWILIRRGRRKTGEMLSATTWSRSKMVGALIMAFALQWSTVTALDNTAKLRATADQAISLTKVRTVLPSAPPYDQNAYDLYLQTAIQLSPDGDLDDPLKDDLDKMLEDSTDPAFDPSSTEVQIQLRENKKTIQLVKEAARKPRLYHPYILDSESIEFPRITPVLYAAKLLTLEARSHVRNRHTAAALENILSIEKIVNQVNQSPLLVNVLIASSINDRSKEALEIILAENRESGKLRIPLPINTHDHILRAFVDGMVFEESFGRFSVANWVIKGNPINFSDIESDELSYFWPPEDNLVNYFSSKMYRIFLFPDDSISREQFWYSFNEYIKKPYYRSGTNLRKWHDHLDKNIDLGFSMAFNPYPMGHYFERVNNAQTQFLLSRLGLAAAVYRSELGKYPNTLEALAPKYITEIPVDPFSGEPLKMIAVKDGLILYGVGPNLKDDQGAPFEKEDYDWDNTKGDIAFYLGSAFKEHRLKPAQARMAVKTVKN